MNFDKQSEGREALRADRRASVPSLAPGREPVQEYFSVNSSLAFCGECGDLADDEANPPATGLVDSWEAAWVDQVSVEAAADSPADAVLHLCVFSLPSMKRGN
jgi:hypothetical protein